MLVPPAKSDSARLIAIKATHSVVWALFAGCIVALPIASWRGQHGAAGWLSAVVFLEVLVLAFNKWSCPLTAVAARYTDDRTSNFDIYLPVWIARYNKEIFGPLYGAGVIYALLNWMLGGR